MHHLGPLEVALSALGHDTAPAGDLLVALLDAAEVVTDAIRFAAAAAALCAGAVGAQAALPTHEQVDRLLAMAVPL